MSLMKSSTQDDSCTTPLAEFGAAIRAARTEKKILQSELAEAVGSTQSLVSAYEKGEHEPPREVVYAIERALDAPAGSLSRFLGYLPVDYDGRTPLSFREFLMRDESTLTPDQRRVFLDLYRQFTGAETTTRSKSSTTSKRAASAKSATPARRRA